MALAEADFSVTQMALDNSGGAPGDETLAVKFYLHPLQNDAKSAEEGRPIFEEVEFVSIMVPGQKDNIVIRPARQADKDRFPRHYAAFKNKQEQPGEGTPLEEWPAITRSHVEELKFFNVHTVEQLANLTDTNAQNFMGIQQLRERAKAFLEASTDVSAVVEKMQAQIEERDNKIESLMEACRELGSEIEKLKGDTVSNSGGHGKSGGGRSRARSSD